MNKFNKLLAGLALTAFASMASAGLITGSINFSGGYTTDNDNALTATVFTFLNPVQVTAADGDFAALDGATVTYGVLDVNGLPSSPLWSSALGAGYNFDLTTITLDTVVFGTRIIKGFGDMSIGSVTDTLSWQLTTQPGGSGTPVEFTFSASSVPEPATALLLGIGLIGFGAARKMRKSA